MAKKKPADVIALENAVPIEENAWTHIPKTPSSESIQIPMVECANVTLPEPEIIPSTTSPEWSDFILKQFTEDEIFDGNPTVDGLRRLAEKYIGEIVESIADSVAQPCGPGRDNCCATVMSTIVFKTESGDFKIYRDIADVTSANTDEIYRMYPSATAATRAEGRALRKALKLRRVVAAEEVKELSVQEIEDSKEKITFGQIGFLKNVGRQIDVDIFKFINAGSGKYNTYKEVTRAKAAEMIQTLSAFKTDMSKIPPALKGYKEGWDR